MLARLLSVYNLGITMSEPVLSANSIFYTRLGVIQGAIPHERTAPLVAQLEDSYGDVFLLAYRVTGTVRLLSSR